MIKLLFFLALLAPLGAPLGGALPASLDGPREKAREGNRLFGQEEYAGAADAYRAALADADDPVLTARLFDNLGQALYASQAFTEARNAFETALAEAPDDAFAARAAYHAGNTAAQQQEIEDALGFYRRALLLDPDHAGARFNYEFLKRQQAQDQQNESQPPPKPSALAQRLKAQADKLVEQRDYQEAFDLMQDGMRRDSTVQAYQDFMARLQTVGQIEASGTTNE